MNDRPDILFIAPPLLWSEEIRPEMKQPLNLLYLASWLNEKGLKAQIIDAVCERLPLALVLQRLEEIRPRFVGIPFYQATRETALELCSSIRKVQPQTWLVGGGPLATTSADDLLASGHLDFCVIGEGEVTLEELLHSDLPECRPENPDLACLQNMPGLAFLNVDQPVYTPERMPIADLDSLPYVDFKLVDIASYFSYHASIDMSDWLFLTTSRGCHARCVFCATPVLWPHGMRRQSAARVLAEIEYQRQRFPTAQIGFMDDSFFSDKAWLKEFFAGISTMQVKYCCIGRADHLDEEDVRGLAASGCIYVAFGIETGNQLRQRSIKKYLNLERARKSVEMLKKFDIFSKGFFMLGFPDETPEEMLATINFAVELKHLGMGECSFFPVSIYPGTELAENFSREHFVSGIYQHTQTHKADEFAESRMLRYANIPTANINSSFSANQILNLVRFAYQKIESGQTARLEEMLKAAE